jgi:hypothetical protein
VIKAKSTGSCEPVQEGDEQGSAYKQHRHINLILIFPDKFEVPQSPEHDGAIIVAPSFVDL